ncbi:hypothetical protein GCK32_001514 [Trichostrongylus colubriformis]|uniref:Uncharacterized protein n=1 Tax=Trichostrongylus colubriformis TaxID=6319 RepID=A0AAN8FLH2_TRICO
MKTFIQDLCSKQLAWVYQLYDIDKQCWRDLIEEIKHPLSATPKLVIPKSAGSTTVELCVFGDASKRLYACCAYLPCRSSTSSNSRLIMAESQLNDLEPITISRAELLAILISTRLTHYIVQQLDMSVSAIHLLSDSQVALHWIHSSRQFRTFVQNRVDSIENVTMSFRSHRISS